MQFWRLLVEPKQLLADQRQESIADLYVRSVTSMLGGSVIMLEQPTQPSPHWTSPSQQAGLNSAKIRSLELQKAK